MAMLEAPIDRDPVESSNLSSVGYCEQRRTLAVMFRDGTLIHYHELPAALYAAMCEAPSKGRFFHAFVRGKFHALKLSGHCPQCGALGLVGLTCVDCGTAEVVADPPKPIKAPKALRAAEDAAIDARAD